MKRLVLLAFAAACSGVPAPQTSPAPADDSSGGWQRVVAGIEVAGPDGAPYAHPFLGGLDLPRPQFLDVDGDGDLDLFVQERSNEVMFFENTGTATQPQLVWREDKFGGLDVGEWYKFVDMDSDGDYDLLAEQPYSYVRLYRNTGSRARAQFIAEVDTLRDEAGKPIFADRQNIANAADIDCNGLMDLFLGRVDGTITRYEEMARSAGAGEPRFRFVTDRFEGIEIVAQQMGGSMHGANAMYFADNDEDGDLDLFWGDFFEAGVLLIRNTGSCQSPNLRTTPENLRDAANATIATSGYNVPVLSDIDGDRDFDLFLGIIGGAFNPNRTTADNFHHYERTARGYELRSTRYLSTPDVGSESAIAVGDIDGDGDHDIVMGNKIDISTLGRAPQHARLYVLRNEGSARAPRFRATDTLSLAPSFHYAPALGDFDGDGRTDLLLGTWNDGVLYYRNAGSRSEPRWEQDTTRTIRITRGSNTTPTLVDIDADGDLDLFIGEASGQLNFYRNEGSRTAPRWELVNDEYEGIDAGRRSHASFFDHDGDGDLDLLLAREEGGAALYRNDGSRTAPRFVADGTFTLPLPALATPQFVDLDGDDSPELLSGGLSGGLFLFRSR